ncbi:beta-lactamase [Pseudomonas sp. CrR25]|nr:beta-lactamase [Pseudomonas sp. CrR25]
MHAKTTTRLRMLCTSALLLGASASVTAAASNDRVGSIVDAAIRPLLLTHEIPGMAVAVSLDGQRYYFNYGVASRETGQAVTPDTLFEIGSVSKTFTATLAAYAQESGRLSLADHASQHLAALQGSSFERISLLDLGIYTAGGLPLQFPDEVTDQQQMIAYYNQWRPTYAPGTHRRYSNPSIGLLGYLTAKSMGESYQALLERRLFPKLGLSHSYIDVPPEQMTHYAQGYTRENTPIRVSPGVLDAEAYGVKSSATDMLRFVEVNLHSAELEAPLQRAIRATHRGHYRVGDMTQGLGWELYPYPLPLERLQAGNSAAMALDAHRVTPLGPPLPTAADRLINKTGSTNGFGAYVAFVPARRIGIVMLANRNYPNAARVEAAHAILTALDRGDSQREPR